MSLVEKALATYVRLAPFEKGKTKLIDFVCRKIDLRGGRIYLTDFGASMNLDLSQHLQRKIYFRGKYEKDVRKPNVSVSFRF